jgi:hypothetical protein
LRLLQHCLFLNIKFKFSLPVIKNLVEEHTVYLTILNLSQKFKICPTAKSLVFEKKTVILRNRQNFKEGVYSWEPASRSMHLLIL